MDDDDPPTPEAALGHPSAWVWTRRAAVEAIGAAAVATRLRTGVWQAPWPGVYADAGSALDPVQRGWAAVLASGGEAQEEASGLRAVATGRTAARCYGWPLIDDDDPATAGDERLLDDVGCWQHARTLVAKHPDGARELRRHRYAFGPGDLVQHESGLWLTSPLRTVVDCAGLLTLEAAVCVADAALRSGSVSAGQLAAAASVRAGRPGAARLRRLSELADGRAESPGETLTRLLLLPHLPGLTPQVRVRSGGRIVARLDLGDPRLRLAVEHDGRAGHEGRAADDHRRDRLVAGEGWTTERVTWFDVRRRQAETLARLRATADRLERQGAVPGQRVDDTSARRAAGAR